MCELLGMSSNHETSINLSLTVLAERGENPRLHGDGWGVAFHEGADVRLIKDAGEAKNSKWVEFIKQQEIRSHDVIAHIRKSTVGEVCYSNTHPFIRELFGRVHSFAHNGTFKDILENPKYRTQRFEAIGTTDSEHSFCYLMDRMYDLWKDYEGTPPFEKRLEVVEKFAKEMRDLGACNFLYSDGDILFAHGHKRHDPITQILSWPGLNYLHLVCKKDDEKFKDSFVSGIALHGEEHTITLFASVPLNDCDWRPLKEGELIAVSKGEILYSSHQDEDKKNDYSNSSYSSSYSSSPS